MYAVIPVTLILTDLQYTGKSAFLQIGGHYILSNLEQMDSTSQEACDWIKDKKITKVLMNPPYERKCHPEVIVKNVLNNIEPHSIAAFLLPDKKLEKISKKAATDILSKHKLLKIIKLPEKTFDEGITTSIFIFESGIPQNDEEIFTCYIKEDGLERVKKSRPSGYKASLEHHR